MKCAWCSAELVDVAGRPRYDLFDGHGTRLLFVCLDGCRTSPRRGSRP